MYEALGSTPNTKKKKKFKKIAHIVKKGEWSQKQEMETQCEINLIEIVTNGFSLYFIKVFF
jgi:hypothetical protein